MLWRIPKHPSRRPHPEGFIIPAQPTLVTKPVTASGWLHEIKHDGYRMVARRFPDGRVALWSRNGIAWTDRPPLIRAALLSLPVESVTLDGEAIAPHPDGTSNFTALRTRGGNAQAELMAFDILELKGEDLRPLPLWHRREVLQGVTLFGHEGLRLSEPIDAPGDLVFRAACQHGLEGIVSKRLDSAYRSGRVKSWVKTKCPNYVRPWCSSQPAHMDGRLRTGADQGEPMLRSAVEMRPCRTILKHSRKPRRVCSSRAGAFS